MTKRVAILISGGGSNMVTLVKSMQADGYAEAVMVLSNVPDAGGLQKAKDLGVPTAVVDHMSFAGDRRAFEQAVDEVLRSAKPDIICLAGFMRVLSEDFVTGWEEQILNIHPSLLPKYKGLHTHERAIQARDSEHGCSVHVVTAALDDGPVLGQAFVSVRDGDTAEDLAARVLVQEHALYPAVLERFVSGAPETVIIDARDS